jgi:hypothetical protein
MINVQNLLALRNAIDALLEGELKEKTPAKRLTKRQQWMQQFEQNFYIREAKKKINKKNEKQL